MTMTLRHDILAHGYDPKRGRTRLPCAPIPINCADRSTVPPSSPARYQRASSFWSRAPCRRGCACCDRTACSASAPYVPSRRVSAAARLRRRSRTTDLRRTMRRQQRRGTGVSLERARAAGRPSSARALQYIGRPHPRRLAQASCPCQPVSGASRSFVICADDIVVGIMRSPPAPSARPRPPAVSGATCRIPLPVAVSGACAHRITSWHGPRHRTRAVPSTVALRVMQAGRDDRHPRHDWPCHLG